MGSIFNADFRDFLRALHEADVRYMLLQQARAGLVTPMGTPRPLFVSRRGVFA